VFSDLGGQSVAGGNIIADFLKDVECLNVKTYLSENGISYQVFLRATVPWVQSLKFLLVYKENDFGRN
jgi:hypothetical protein